MKTIELAEKMYDEVRDKIPYDGPSLNAYTLDLCRYFLNEVYPHITDVEELKRSLTTL